MLDIEFTRLKIESMSFQKPNTSLLKDMKDGLVLKVFEVYLIDEGKGRVERDGGEKWSGSFSY